MKSALAGIAATLPSGHGWIGAWAPGIGDPTFVGWFTVVAYFAAVVGCWQVLRTLSRTKNNASTERRFWVALALALLFLGFNKQLDLQTAFTEIMRTLARRQGWYEHRRVYQLAFIAAMTLALPIGIWSCFRVARGMPASVKTAGAGLIAIAGFVLVRAASFHHIDRLLGETVLLLNVNWLLELGGITVVLVGARWRLRQLHATSAT
jgi:hypothetical protein